MADLTTLSKAKAYIQPDDDADDEVIADLIRFASALIRTYLGRPLTVPPVTEQRGLYVAGRRSLRLVDRLTNVTAITAPYPYQRALLAGEYELQQFAALTQLNLERAVEGKMVVSGTWGWSYVPGDIELATIATVDEWYRSNVLPTTGGREEGAPESRNIYLPREVQEILRPWQAGMLIA